MREARRRGESVADPRSGYMKFTTTNALLAYYTIMLWNSPEFFTGFTITLPATHSEFGFQQSDVINIPPVSDSRNVHESPLYGYYMALAAEVMLQGALASAILKGDAEEASRMYLNLYGTSDITSAADLGLRGTLNKLTALIRPIEKRSSSEDKTVVKELEAELGTINSALARGRITDPEGIKKAQEEIAELKYGIRVLSDSGRYEETELAALLKAAEHPSKAQNVVTEAWRTLESTPLWKAVMAGKKTLENRGAQRARRL